MAKPEAQDFVVSRYDRCVPIARSLRKCLLVCGGVAVVGLAALLWWPEPALPEWRGVDFGLDGTAASVFDPGKVLVFELDLAPADLARMQEYAAAELVVPASLKVVFDHVVETRTFCGLRRLNFHSMIYDRSLMRDRLCYEVFRAAGFATPRCSHAMLVVNGENLGLYAMVEQIDQAFVEDRFGAEAKGLLYKEVWPVHRDRAAYQETVRSKPRGRI